MSDMGTVRDSGNHSGTKHNCPNFGGGEVSFDNGRFRKCPFGCGFQRRNVLDA